MSSVRANSAQFPTAEPQGADGSTFCDSLKAHLGSQNAIDGQPEAGSNATATATSSSTSAAEANAADGSGANPVFPSATGDTTASFETELKHLARNRHTRFVPPTTSQQQSLRAGGSRAATTINVKKSISVEITAGSAHHVGVAQDGMAMVPPMSTAIASNENGPTGCLEIDISDSVENSSTISGDASSSSGFASSWVTLEDGQVQRGSHHGWPAASADGHPAVPRIVETESPKVNDGYRAEPVDDRAAPFQSRPFATSGLDAGAGLQKDEDGGQDSASNEVISTVGPVGGEHLNVERRNSGSARQGVAIAPEPEANSTQNKSPNHEKYIDANVGSSQASLNSAVVEAGRDTDRSANSKASFPTGSADGFAKATANVKSSSSHSDQSNVHSQDLKHVLTDAATAFAPHSPETSRVEDATNNGSTNPKTTDAISSDSRLQNTFYKLEPGDRSGGGAMNWTRVGNMQAEVGYQDPTLGWVGIRAEASGGAIHATLIPQSSDAAQVLGGHVSGLHTYLAENHTPVETLSLASSGGNTQQFTGHHPGQETQQDSGQNAGQRHMTEAVPEPQLISRQGRGSAVRNASSSDGSFTQSHGGVSSGGVHISVLA